MRVRELLACLWFASLGWLLFVLGTTLANAQTCTGVTYQPSALYTRNGVPLFRQMSAPMWFSAASTANRNSANAAFWSQYGLEFALYRLQSGASTCYRNHSAPGLSSSGAAGEVRANQYACSNPASAGTDTSLFITIDEHQVNGQCEPPPEECDPGFMGVGDSWSTTVSGPSRYCHALSHCLVQVTSSACVGSSCSRTFRHTDQTCTPDDDEGGDDEDNGEACASSGGVTFCKDDDDDTENCGFLNDNFVCLSRTDDDGCQVFGDGSRVCGQQAPTPPVPDNGTPGTPATPDGVITTINNSYDFYNSTTVSSSARPPGTSGDNPNDGEDDGTGGGTGLNSAGNPTSGDGDGEGEGECPEGATCDGSLPDQGEFEDVCSFGQCTEQFFSRIRNAPLFDGVLSAGAMIPAGSCPSWNVEVFDDTFSLSAPMCSIWEDVAPLLSAAFIFIWAWVGTRIVLSA